MRRHALTCLVVSLLPLASCWRHTLIDPGFVPDSAPVLLTSDREGKSQLYRYDPSHESWTRLTGLPDGANWPVWSRRAGQIAFQSRREGKFDVWVVRADGSEPVRLTDDPDHDYLPSWSPDGRFVAFASWRQQPGDAEREVHLYIMRADGSGQRRLMAASPRTSGGVEWSPDGRWVVFAMRSEGDGADLFSAQVLGGDEPTLGPLTRLTDDAPAYCGAPAVSPDGSLIAFYRDDGAGADLVVMSRDGSHRRTVAEGGNWWYPEWSPDGKWIMCTAPSSPGDNENLALWIIAADGSVPPRVLVDLPGRDSEGSWWR